jgi:IclR family pca regulon transcriptional regulator
MDGNDIVYVARSGSHRHMHNGYLLGSRVQAHSTAAGMMMLSLTAPEVLDIWLQTQSLRAYTSHTITDRDHLRELFAEVRTQGWCVSEQQLELNYRGIAVPIYDHNDQLLGAMNVTMPINSETTEAALSRVLPVLQETARSMRPLI